MTIIAPPSRSTTITGAEMRDGITFIHDGERAVVDRRSDVRAGIILDIDKGHDLDTILIQPTDVFDLA